MDAAPERKLTTILVADAAGYSRMMGEDEAATLTLLRSYRELIGAQIARHRGRVVSTSGDNVLAEFASVVNAVECAVRIQRELAERNAGLPEVRRMRFRIGINLGDVLVEGDDLFGEGVNIAARLEQLADPDDVLISGAVFEQVRTKLSLGFDFLGPQAVKNIADLVPVYRVNLDVDGISRGPAPPSPVPLPQSLIEPPRSPLRARFYRRTALVVVLIGFLLAINLLTSAERLWFQWPTLGILFVYALRTISSGWK